MDRRLPPSSPASVSPLSDFPSCVDELRRRRRRHVLAGSLPPSVRPSVRHGPPPPLCARPVGPGAGAAAAAAFLLSLSVLCSSARRPAGHVLARARARSTFHPPLCRGGGGTAASSSASSSAAASASCTSMRFCHRPPRPRGFIKRCLPSVSSLQSRHPGRKIASGAKKPAESAFPSQVMRIGDATATDYWIVLQPKERERRREGCLSPGIDFT